MHTTTSFASLAALLFALTACNNPKDVTNPAEVHTLQGKDPDGYAVTYDARGRGAYLVDYQSTTAEDGRIYKSSGLAICAEPPPDAVANNTSSSKLDASLEAIAKFKALDSALNGDLSRETNTTSEITNVATRTELVLLMRSAMYRICELNVNGVLSNESAEQAFSDVLLTARVLGQRDNVAKLIEVLHLIVTHEGDAALHAALITEVTRTIRLVVLGEQMMQGSDAQRSEAVAALGVAMYGELGKDTGKTGVQKLMAMTKARIDALKAKDPQTPEIIAEVARREKQLQVLESIAAFQ